ncbi:MAG TPA: Flp pilus assembly protein CpaB [Quisquiliibacterium sp.]|nr:Flp pilus assembly protein CpaB [Quisquiliibacterium sp.]
MNPFDRIKKHRNAAILVCALALGTLSALGARGYIANEIARERDRLQPRQPMVEVVVAKRDLAKGDPVDGDTMAVRMLPRDHLPASTVPPERFDGFVGARLSAAMRAGEPLLQGAIEGADVSTFSAKVRTGIRALTISVDEINSLSGMLQPGDRIDLMLSVRMPGSAALPFPNEITRPLMQDLRVLATGRQVRPGGDDRQGRTYTAITVEVSPVQAQKLVVAQRSGKLTALLRNPQDRTPLEQTPMDVFALLDLKAPAYVPPAPVRAVELIVGGRGALKTTTASDDERALRLAPAASSERSGVTAIAGSGPGGAAHEASGAAHRTPAAGAWPVVNPPGRHGEVGSTAAPGGSEPASSSRRPEAQ